MEFLDYKYSIDRDSRRFSIDSLTDRTLPKYIGKFMSLSERKIDSLINERIYATEISKLNDIFEGKQVHSILEEIVTQHSQRFQSIPQEALRYWNRVNSYSKFGIVSFSTNPYSVTMWGLYCNNDGYYVEYDSEEFLNSVYTLNSSNHLLFSNLTRVRYVEDYKAFAQALLESEDEYVYRMLASIHTKMLDWKLENEFRLVVKNDGTEMSTRFTTKGNFFDYSDVGHFSREMRFDLSSISRIILSAHFFRHKDFIDYDKEGGIVQYGLSETGIDSSRYKILQFSINKNIPLFIVGINHFEPVIYKIEIEINDKGIKARHLYNINYTKSTDPNIHAL